MTTKQVTLNRKRIIIYQQLGQETENRNKVIILFRNSKKGERKSEQCMYKER